MKFVIASVAKQSRKEVFMENINFFVYILFNKRNGALYVGVTDDIKRRIDEHKAGKSKFTAKYKIDKLGYIEKFNYINEAIEREKQLKGGSRKNKLKLIEDMNPNWQDLSEFLDDIV